MESPEKSFSLVKEDGTGQPREKTDVVLEQIRLQVLDGNHEGSECTFDLLQSRPCIRLGSDGPAGEEHALILRDRGISRWHASLVWRDGCLFLRDEGSTNGTSWQEVVIAQETLLPRQGIFALQTGPTQQIRIAFAQLLALRLHQETKSAASAQEEKDGKTDVVLSQISLRVQNGQAKDREVQVTLLQSRPSLAMGKDRAACGQEALILEDEGISALHATLCWNGSQVVLRDEDSTNGTYYQGRRLQAGEEVSLGREADLRLGPVLLRYTCHFPEGDGESSSPVHGDEVVIAEFTLVSLDAQWALPRHGEVKSNKKAFLIGRSAKCDYRVEFNERFVANEQALIVYAVQEDAFAIRSLMPDNPISVNDQRVSSECRLQAGDVIRLGLAKSAPAIRFDLEGNRSYITPTGSLSSVRGSSSLQKLSLVLPTLERGKSYWVGGASSCAIRLGEPAPEYVLEIQVPLAHSDLRVKKYPGVEMAVHLDGVALGEGERQPWKVNQVLQCGRYFAWVYDQPNLLSTTQAQQHLLSDFISYPQRDATYLIGSERDCEIHLEQEGCPRVVAELSVPLDGDSFRVRKYSGVDLPVFVDEEEVNAEAKEPTAFGVNQVLRIEPFLIVRNNHRFLPPASRTHAWKRIFVGVSLSLLLILLCLGGGLFVKRYWGYLEGLLSEKNLIKQYQENVFYIITFDPAGERASSGSGFLYSLKDAQDRETDFLLITCKHVVEPWKFKPHKFVENKWVDEEGKPLVAELQIAVWQCGQQAIDAEKKTHLLEFSFTNRQVPVCLGKVTLLKVAADDWEETDKGYRQHKTRSNSDLAILQLHPTHTDWQSSYRSWSIDQADKLEVGEKVIVLGYPLGGGRIAHRKGLAIPASCAGQLTSSCEGTDFLELDVNQTHGSSGGPIINHRGEILGVLSFANNEKNLIYGIRGQIIQNLLRGR